MSWERRARVHGPLGPFADGFRVELQRLGYTPFSSEAKVQQVARLSRWLEERGLDVSDVDDARVAAFIAEHRAGKPHGQPRSLEGMRPLLDWLRSQEVVGSQRVEPASILDEFIDRYRHWMITDRGLAARTVGRYEKTARRFLAERVEAAEGAGWVIDLDAKAVTEFLLAGVSRGLSPGSMQGRVAEMRSVLRFLYLHGLIEMDLAQAVPPVPGWKDTRVPPRMHAGEVQRLLDSCDRDTAAGRRDLAMLMVMARLGLRAAEVAGLELGDIDWRSGEVVVCGKARRVDRMPLPADVGEALAAYLLDGRPKAESRAVFLTVAAPPRPLWSTAVSQTVWRQCHRAGIAPIRAHRLRHALATDLLDHGLKLAEIAQTLRHRDLATTAAYAKVDYASLRQLALPWPELSR